MHSELGRPSIPPDRLLERSLPMAFYTVRSERAARLPPLVPLVSGSGNGQGWFRSLNLRARAAYNLFRIAIAVRLLHEIEAKALRCTLRSPFASMPKQ
jgi:hypothetical protein